MRVLNKLKNLIYILAFDLFKEETYEEDLRRNFSLKYAGLPKKNIYNW